MDTSQVTKRETPVPEQLSVVEKVFFVSVLTLIFFPFPLLVVGGLWLKSRMPFTDFIRFKFMKGWKRVSNEAAEKRFKRLNNPFYFEGR